jgi:hypothetical protein
MGLDLSYLAYHAVRHEHDHAIGLLEVIEYDEDLD